MLQIFWFVFALDLACGYLPEPSGYLEVYALPVGQGDCTVIQCPKGQLVINDCGTKGGAKLYASEIKTYLGKRVDDIAAIIISHPDEDHYSYLPEITDSNNANIKSVIIGGTLEEYRTKKHPRIHGWLKNFGKRFHTVDACIGNCKVTGGTDFCQSTYIKFKFLAANVGSRANEKSIVLKVTSGDFSILLPGDLEGEASKEIARTLSPDQLHSYVYKIAHHGACRVANSPEWLKHIRPRRAFASSGYDFGNCKHPRCVTIKRIRSLDTIDNHDNHDFYCGNGNGEAPTDFPTFTKHIYETNPRPEEICLLVYVADHAKTFNACCTDVQNVPTEVFPSSCRPKLKERVIDILL